MIFETVAGEPLLVGEAKISDKAEGERVDYDLGASPAVSIAPSSFPIRMPTTACGR